MEKDVLLPKLNNEQINKIAQYGIKRRVSSGGVLIRLGERNHKFYVVIDGAIKILDDKKRKIAIHGPGEFTGNSDNLSERSAVFSAVAHTDCDLLELSHDQLKDFISKDQDLSEVLLRTFLLRRMNELERNIGAIELIGSRFSPETYKLREFLSKNHVQFNWIDLEKDETSEKILKDFNITAEDTPLIIVNQDKIYKNPSIESVAEVLGLSSYFKEEIWDVIVVGAGPAGLAASVYASSEGLKVVTIDKIGPGGQAGASSKIENYLGFPMGISGGELANNAYIQAQKFGCLISIPHIAKSLRFKENAFHLELFSGETIKGSTVIAATGAMYRKLQIENLNQFEGRGIYYGASEMEAQYVSEKEIIIVGGGNSAGQAAIFLANNASKVHLIIRGEDLSKSMSSYLINRIVNDPKIEIHNNTEVKELSGKNWLEEVVVENNKTRNRSILKISNLFLFLGAKPCSDWLSGVTFFDKSGFIYTGKDIPAEALSSWPKDLAPQSLETCFPGLFAVGDIRHGSVKRVASAVGEGSMAVSQIHQFLGQNESFKS